MSVQQAKFFGALAHPVRLRILDILARDEACVCHLCVALNQRQAYVSQQLARLKQAGLIVDRKEGLFVYYSLADPSVIHLLDEARNILARTGGDESLPQPESRAQASGACPCPKCHVARNAVPGPMVAAEVAG